MSDITITMKDDNTNSIVNFFSQWQKSIEQTDKVELVLTEEVIQEMIAAGAIINGKTLEELRSFIGCTFYPSNIFLD